MQICSVPNGVCLIDEIENGFYFKTLPQMWEVVTYLCDQCSVQLFASTHSKECLQYLEPILSKFPDKFRLLRAKTLENGEHVVNTFGGKDVEAALETGTEIR
jgi:AAA15 family ATPase/GTPase